MRAPPTSHPPSLSTLCRSAPMCPTARAWKATSAMAATHALPTTSASTHRPADCAPRPAEPHTRATPAPAHAAPPAISSATEAARCAAGAAEAGMAGGRAQVECCAGLLSRSSAMWAALAPAVHRCVQLPADGSQSLRRLHHVCRQVRARQRSDLLAVQQGGLHRLHLEHLRLHHLHRPVRAGRHQLQGGERGRHEGSLLCC